MGNCYGRQNNKRDNYVNKDIQLYRKIGARVSICKSDQKIGLDTNLSGSLTTLRKESYTIPSVIELVEIGTQTE